METLSPLWGEVTGRPFQPELMRLYRERADAALDDFCAAAERLEVRPVERCVEIGVAEDVILDRAGAAELLVMGRTGKHGGLGRRALGATLWRVLHRAPCPVLVAPASARERTPDAPEFGASDVPVRPLLAWEPGPGAIAAVDVALEYCRVRRRAVARRARRRRVARCSSGRIRHAAGRFRRALGNSAPHSAAGPCGGRGPTSVGGGLPVHGRVRTGTGKRLPVRIEHRGDSRANAGAGIPLLRSR